MSFSSLVNFFAVYPCVYREHSDTYAAGYYPNGLSLCIQGTYDLIMSEKYKKRFIPVYTGNIWKDEAPNALGAVYPCVYREHVDVILEISFFRGLSLCIQGT